MNCGGNSAAPNYEPTAPGANMTQAERRDKHRTRSIGKQIPHGTSTMTHKEFWGRVEAHQRLTNIDDRQLNVAKRTPQKP